MLRLGLLVLVGCGRLGFAPYSVGAGDDGGNGDSTDSGTSGIAMGRIAAGFGFTCMVRVDGSAWCWGLSDNRQLGNDSLVSQATPTRVATLPAISKISAGIDLACAIDRAGGVWCWGDNGNGGHGDGSESFVPTPEQALLARPATAIGVGGGHACAVLDDATLWCWGSNYNGECGIDPSATTVPTPTQILDHTLEVTAGEVHTCALRDDGSVWCWGGNDFGQLGDNTGGHYQPAAVPNVTAIAIASSTNHECALVAGGRFSCWGSNGNSQLGISTMTSASPTPAAPSSTSGWVALTAADRHTCGLAADSTVSCWGGDGNGQLGDGAIFDQVAPQLTMLSGTIVGIAASDSHTCALRDDDSVACWGIGSHGELAAGIHAQLLPQHVALPGAATAIAAQGDFACALVGSNVSCWGYDSAGQLGDLGAVQDYVSSTAVTIPGVTNATAIAAGTEHACAITATGLTCWGRDDAGQLGDGTNNSYALGATAASGVGSPLGALGLGDNFSCAVGGGTLRCWGSDDDGQVGDGGGNAVLVPKAVAGLSTVTALSGSTYNACAIGAASHVSCWGANNEGEVGNGMTGQAIASPTATSGGHTYSAIATGDDHSCAVRTTGSVDCWGYNDSGDLGDGTYDESSVPTATTIVSGATAVAAGHDFSCALISNAVSCWGANAVGQLGDGTTNSETTAKQIVVGTVPVIAIAAGDEFACGLGNDGKVWCWGDNARGQMANGTTSRSLVPVEAAP